MKIVAAIPVYDGKLFTQVVKCLMGEQIIAKECGDDFQVRFLPSCSHPAMGRNQLAKDFMEGDFDRLIFLDADVTFQPGDLVKLAHYPVDFVGGAYRFKLPNECYPVGFIEGEIWSNELGLIEVATLPGGFMALTRRVFEKLQAAHPERTYKHLGVTAHCYFQMKFEDGGMYGEDSFFCKEWTDLGEKVFLDPEITLTHWDFAPVPYAGRIGHWLKSRAGLPIEIEKNQPEPLKGL